VVEGHSSAARVGASYEAHPSCVGASYQEGAPSSPGGLGAGACSVVEEAVEADQTCLAGFAVRE
jgi:hypothetical protein